MIKTNRNIKGINIKDTEYIISLYADDTTLILDGSEKSLREAIKTLDSFYKISGLKINISKTQITWIGSNKHRTDKICQDIDFNWTTSFTLLGIQYDVDLMKITILNYEKMYK